MLLISLLACISQESVLIGTIVEHSNGNAVAAPHITILDLDGQVFSEVDADAAGKFEVALPPFNLFFALIEHNDFRSTSFSGYSGDGVFDSPEGTLYLRTEETIRSTVEDFTSCDTEIDDDGTGWVDGIVRLGIPNVESEELPIITAAEVVVTASDEQRYPACMIPTVDEDGTEQDSNRTGETGRFWIPKLPVGVANLEITVHYNATENDSFDYPVYVPKNGSTPIYPALVPMTN